MSNTLAQSYVHETSQTTSQTYLWSQTPGAAAKRKTNKYSSLTQSDLFVPFAAETMGTINKEGVDFLSDLEAASHKAQLITTRAPASSSDYPFKFNTPIRSLSWVPWG